MREVRSRRFAGGFGSWRSAKSLRLQLPDTFSWLWGLQRCLLLTLTSHTRCTAQRGMKMWRAQEQGEESKDGGRELPVFTLNCIKSHVPEPREALCCSKPTAHNLHDVAAPSTRALEMALANSPGHVLLHALLIANPFRNQK